MMIATISVEYPKVLQAVAKPQGPNEGMVHQDGGLDLSLCQHLRQTLASRTEETLPFEVKFG